MELNAIASKIITFTEERKQTYLKLSYGFSYPERETIEELWDKELFGDLMQFSIDEIIQFLQVEFTRLFINTAYESLLAPPYESYYQNERSLLMSAPIITELEYLFQITGLEFAGRDLSPDHIAVEMEYMSYLVEEEQKYRNNNDNSNLSIILDLQKHFIDKHLKLWTISFFEKTSQHSNYHFYKKLSQIGQEFIQTETDYLSKIK